MNIAETTEGQWYGVAAIRMPRRDGYGVADAEDELERLRARASGLLPGDGDPVYRDVARRLALVPEGGDESA